MNPIQLVFAEKLSKLSLKGGVSSASPKVRCPSSKALAFNRTSLKTFLKHRTDSEFTRVHSSNNMNHLCGILLTRRTSLYFYSVAHFAPVWGGDWLKQTFGS